MQRWISYLAHQPRNIMVYFNTHKTYYDIPIHFDKPPLAIKAYLVGNSIRVEADLTKSATEVGGDKPADGSLSVCLKRERVALAR